MTVDTAPNRLDNLRTLRFANLDAAFATGFISLTTGGILVGFIKEIKPEGADLWIGLLPALPALAGIAQIAGSSLGRRYASYKKFIFAGGLLWRLLQLPLVILPLIAFAADIRLGILLVCTSLAAICANLANPIYSDWLAELVPSNSRGAFFSSRNTLLVIAGSVTGIIGGLVLDKFKEHHLAAIGFSTIFGIGLLLGAVSLYYFGQMTDLKRENPVQQNLAETFGSLRVPFKDQNFRRVMLFLGIFIAGQVLPGNLWAAYSFESLKFNFFQLSLLGVFHAGGNVIMASQWGFLADKYGNKPILAICAVGMVLSPIAWLLCPPGNPQLSLAILLPAHILMGMNFSGVMLCQGNILFSTSPAATRSIYLGAAMATQSIVGCVAPLMGAGLLAIFRHTAQADIAYKEVFLVAMLIRVGAIFLLFPIKEEGSKGFKDTIRHLRAVTPSGLRAMKRFGKSGEVAEREEAIKTMADESLSLAVDELVTALHDPSPRVRRQAAIALGRLGDASAVEDLIHQLVEHPDLVEEETVAALGEIGEPNAIPELVNLLQSPRPLLRRAAAKSISMSPGATDNSVAVQALVRAAEDADDPDLRRASLQALRNMEAVGIAATLSHALLDKHPSVRIAAAEAIAELNVTQASDACRAALIMYKDEASAEVAYALGVIGNLSDCTNILMVAESCVSMITRRRCLLGVARLFGVEQAVYKILMTSGMFRDASLVQILKVHGKSSRSAQIALGAMASGDEAGAIQALSLGSDAEPLKLHPVPESFIVAACIYSERMNRRTKSQPKENAKEPIRNQRASPSE